MGKYKKYKITKIPDSADYFENVMKKVEAFCNSDEVKSVINTQFVKTNSDCTKWYAIVTYESETIEKD